MSRPPRRFHGGLSAGAALTFVLALAPLSMAEEGEDFEAQRAQARAHQALGQAALEEGDHSEALRELQQAFDLGRDPVLRYDLGRCHLELGHRVEARRELGLYLAEVDPALISAERRQEVEALLDRAAEEPPAPVEPAPVVEPEPEPVAEPAVEPAPSSRRGLSPAWFWSTLGLAAALAIGGTVTGALVLSAGEEYEQLRDDYIGGDAGAYARGMDTRDRAEDLATATNVLFPVAGVFAAAALVLVFFTEFRGDESGSSALHLTARPDRFGFLGRFDF